jgi:hypothetical protein
VEFAKKYASKSLIMPQLRYAGFIGKDDKVSLRLRFTDPDGHMKDRLNDALKKIERDDSPLIKDLSHPIEGVPEQLQIVSNSIVPEKKPADPQKLMRENIDFMCDDVMLEGEQQVSIRLKNRDNAIKIMEALYDEMPFGLGNVSLMPSLKKMDQRKQTGYIPFIKVKGHVDHYDPTNELGPLSVKLLRRLNLAKSSIFADPSQGEEGALRLFSSSAMPEIEESEALAAATGIIKTLKKDYLIETYQPNTLHLVGVELQYIGSGNGRGKKKKNSTDPKDYRSIATLRGVDDEAVDKALTLLDNEFHGMMHVVDRDYDKHTARLFMEGNSNPTMLVTMLHHITGCELPVKLKSGAISSRGDEKVYRPRLSVELDKDQIWGFDDGVLVKSTARMAQYMLNKPCQVKDSTSEPKSRLVIEEPCEDKREAFKQARHARDILTSALQRHSDRDRGR